MSLPGGLTPRVDLYYSGVWNNITADVLARDNENSIVINRGRASEDSSITPATCSMSWKNPDGKYSPRNAASPLYGLIGRNTPVRVGIGAPCIAAVTSTGAGSTNLVAPTITAEATGLEIAAWVAVPVGDITVPGAFTGSTERDGAILTFNTATKVPVAAGATGTVTATYSLTATGQAAANVHIPGASAVSSSVSGLNVSAGADANLTPTTAAGQILVAICAWDDDTENRMQPPKIQGDRGLGWMLLADSGSAAVGIPRIMVWSMTATGSTMGQFSLVGKRDGVGDAVIRVYALTGGSTYLPRFTGEISEFPVAWSLRGTDVWTPVTAAGITRRLSSPSTAALRSAVYESFTRRPNTLAYWPLEDPTGSGSFSSALTGGLPMAFAAGSVASPSVAPILAASSAVLGSSPIPTFTNAGARGPVAPYTSTGEIAFGLLASIPAAGTTAGANIMALDFVGGNMSTFVLEYTSNTTVTAKAEYNDGTATVSTALTPSFTFNGTTLAIWIIMNQSGATVPWTLWVAPLPTDGTDGGLGVTAPATLAATTMGVVKQMTIGVETGTGATLHTNGIAFGHAFVVSETTNVFNLTDYTLGATSLHALQGWNNQKVADRVYRLATDNLVTVAVTHLDTNENEPSNLMGLQMPATLMHDLQEAENTGAGGSLYDAAGFLGVSYRGRVSKQSQAPKLTLSYSAMQLSSPLLPLDDDQRTENDVTVNRVGGASGRSVLTTGKLSVQPFPNGVGTYRQAYDLSLFLDSQAQAQANWRMHLGTIDEARWPSVTIDLNATANSAVPATLAILEIGDTVRLTNLPAWAPPGPVDLLLEGYTEHIGSKRWLFTGNYSSASGFRVALLDSATFGRLDSAASTTSGTLTTGATSMTVAITDGTLWVTTALNPAEFPFDILVAGERMTVTAIVGTSSPQTFTVTRSINSVVKTHAVGEKVSLAVPVYLGL